MTPQPKQNEYISESEHTHTHSHEHDDGCGCGTSNKTIRYSEPKLGRNDPCHCGSGKKYKKCCLN